MHSQQFWNGSELHLPIWMKGVDGIDLLGRSTYRWLIGMRDLQCEKGQPETKTGSKDETFHESTLEVGDGDAVVTSPEVTEKRASDPPTFVDFESVKKGKVAGCCPRVQQANKRLEYMSRRALAPVAGGNRG